MKEVIVFLLYILKCSCAEEEYFSTEVSITEAREITDVSFHPNNLSKVSDGTQHTVKWFTTLPQAHHALITDDNKFVSNFSNFKEVYTSEDGSNVTGFGSFNITTFFIGYNTYNLTIYDKYNNTLGSGEFDINVILAYQLLNDIFTYSTSILVFLVYINMGATLDLSVVKQIIKKPIGPLIGLVCQYVFMPLIAFGLSKAYFGNYPLLRLGMFLNGASPGGGPSNMWTYLMGGSLDLSIMMTFCSTLVAFGTVPLWVSLLGPYVLAGTEFVIPFLRIFILVISLAVPCSIGVGIQLYSPKAGKFIENHMLKKQSVFNILYMVTFGFYAYRYVFSLITLRIFFASFSLPVLGYLSGALMATLARRSKEEIIAIAIETGVQNALICVLILKFSLESPSSDLTVVVPITTVILTPIPLAIGVGIRYLLIYLKKRKRDDASSPTIEEHSEISKSGIQNKDFSARLERIRENKETNGINGGIRNPAADFRDETL